MVNNKQKSKCQLRLEARSLAYQQKHQAEPTAAAEPYAVRIERATETRISAQRQRRARARARVQHAQRVAAETRAKRREAQSQSRLAAREKLEIASARREDALQRLQEGCKRRVEAVLEKVESMKEVQRYREERQRRALEDQLVDAARRREEQTQKMVRRLSQRWQSVESVKDRVQRAKFIQRWYRRHVDARKAASKLQTVTAHLETLVKSWRRIGKSGFEDSIRIMQNRDLTRAAQYVLRVLLPSASGDQSPSKDSSPRSNKSAPYRVLLMVGMIVAHPNEIMENNKCERLVFASKALTRDMERILVHLRVDPAECTNARALKSSVTQMEARFAFYFECFSYWKDRDAQRLAQEMLRSYHDIYRTKIHYSAQDIDHADDGMHQLIHQTEKQLMQLRGAIAQVIGKEDAHDRISAIEQSLNSTAQRASADNDADMDQDTEPYPVNENEKTKPTTDFKTQTATPSLSSSSQPPAQVQSLLGDEKLVHELIINPSFRLPSPSDDDSLPGRVRRNMLRAFWDQAVAANDVETLLVHLEELRTLFVGVVKSSDLVDEVSGALSASVLRELLSNPSENYAEVRSRCVRVLRLIRQAEAPARNEATDNFLAAFERWSNALVVGHSDAPTPIRVLVDFLAFALEKVEQIRADMVNTHLGVLATYLVHHGAEYEQKKLQEKITSSVKFPMLDKWIRDEVESRKSNFSEEMKTHLHGGSASAYSELLRSCMMTLVTKYIEGSADVWPESFAHDVDRIRGFRDALDRITLISTMLIVVQDYQARRRLPTTPDFFARLGKDLSVLLSSPGVSGANLVTRALDELLQFQSSMGVNVAEDPEFQALEHRLQGSFQPGNPVFTLFFSRVTSAVQSVSMSDRGEWSMHPSLAPFEGELRDIAFAMRKLFKLNEFVYATLYNAAIKKALASV